MVKFWLGGQRVVKMRLGSQRAWSRLVWASRKVVKIRLGGQGRLSMLG